MRAAFPSEQSTHSDCQKDKCRGTSTTNVSTGASYYEDARDDKRSQPAFCIAGSCEMSRYDFEHETDDFLNQPIPQQNQTSQSTSFPARGQGEGSKGAGDEQQPNDGRQNDSRESPNRDTIQERQDERLDLERDHSLDLSDSELQTLSDLGTFRSIKFDDLVHYRYGDNTTEARTELNRLARAGLMHRHVIPRSHSEVYALTPLGRQTI